MEEQQMDIELLLESYISDPVVKWLNEYYGELSFIEILRVDRKEIYHSYFLKWLFEDKELSELANRFLLSLLLKRARQQGSHFPKDIKYAILTNAFDIDNVEAKVEDNVQIGESKGRCDVLIEMSYHVETSSKLYVFIENKVYSPEHKVGSSGKSQTEFYYDYYCDKFGGSKCLFVFLDLTNSIDLNNYIEPGCKCKKYVHINYQDLLDFVLSPLSRNDSVQKRKQFILNEYIKGLSINYTQKTRIMALEENLRNLLIEFWNNNHQLIELSIEALAQDPNMDSEEREAVNSVNESVQKMKRVRDTTHYQFGGKQCNGKQELVVEVLGWCLEQKLSVKEINKKWQCYLKKVSPDDFYKEGFQQWTFQKHKGYGRDDLYKAIKGLKKWNLMFGKNEYEEELKKERKNKNLEHNYKYLSDNRDLGLYFNQWGWANIDVLIQFYRNLDLDISESKPEIKLL